MRVAFRCDASLNIGSGHVMRCLTLATAFKQHDIECHFICRDLFGSLINSIRLLGFTVSVLTTDQESRENSGRNETNIGSSSTYESWLGCSWETDARQTIEVLTETHPDWLVVDHYALGWLWEVALGAYCSNLFVIDDLADRLHRCDLLLDQTLGRSPLEYRHLTPNARLILAGTQYALLRPEFAQLRQRSLDRRSMIAAPRRILITLGGIDKDNVTELVLQTLKRCGLPEDSKITVVMGENSPWLLQVKSRAKQMPWETEVLVNIHDMAQRMADSDMAIGAAGSTSWERCCLGVPSLVIALADNQLPSAVALEDAGAAVFLGRVEQVEAQLPIAVKSLLQIGRLQVMSNVAAKLVDGLGVERVIESMGALSD